MNSIKLSTPPGSVGVSASGGDGPENGVAATTSLLQTFKASDNLLAFIITDDAPHHASFGVSQEAEAEKRWLTENGFANHDVFARLNELVESLNVTLVPVLYGNALAYKWYKQAAVLTDGLVLCPESNESRVLAAGLALILDAVQRLAISREIDHRNLQQMAENFRGFAVLGLNAENFEPLEGDPASADDCQIEVVKNKGVGEIRAALLGLLQTTFDRFSGKKSSKRCRTVDASVVAGSVRVLVMSMLHAIDSPLIKKEELENVAKLMDTLEKGAAETAKFVFGMLEPHVKVARRVQEHLLTFTFGNKLK